MKEAIEKVIAELDKKQDECEDSDFENGYWYGLDYAINKLKAVLAEDGTQIQSEESTINK